MFQTRPSTLLPSVVTPAVITGGVGMTGFLALSLADGIALLRDVTCASATQEQRPRHCPTPARVWLAYLHCAAQHRGTILSPSHKCPCTSPSPTARRTSTTASFFPARKPSACGP